MRTSESSLFIRSGREADLSRSAYLSLVFDSISKIKINPVRFESDVCNAISEQLSRDGIFFKKEARINKKSRVDFLVDGGIAIEVKKGKPNCRAVEDQVVRYCKSDLVTAMILVSERGLYNPPINEFNRKRILYISLSANWGLAT